MIRALFFDFDGLILDTEGAIHQSWQEVYHYYGVRLDFDKWSKTIGTVAYHFDPLTELEELIGKSVEDRQSILEMQERREKELAHSQPIQPGVQEYLVAAKRLGLKIGLASCSTRSWVIGHLERLDLLDYFDCIKTIEDVVRVKPDPELYLSVMKDLDLQPDEAIVFEDSPSGISAAKQAGLFCVAVPNGLTSRLFLDHADLRLKSIADMPLETLLLQVEKKQSP